MHPHAPNIIHLMRGEVYEIDGKRIFCMGGAISTDKEDRKEGKNWWKGEEISDSEIENAIRNLERYDYTVDYIFTHTPPCSVVKDMRSDYVYCRTADFLEKISADITYKAWYCGHIHRDMEIPDRKIHCVYRKVIKCDGYDTHRSV